MILFRNVSLSRGKSTTRFAGSPFFRRKVTIFIGRETKTHIFPTKIEQQQAFHGLVRRPGAQKKVGSRMVRGRRGRGGVGGFFHDKTNKTNSTITIEDSGVGFAKNVLVNSLGRSPCLEAFSEAMLVASFHVWAVRGRLLLGLFGFG